MLLEIRDIKTNSFKICVKPSDTIMQVKEKIKKLIAILDIEDQTLVYSGNMLANDSTVEECDLNKDDYVTLVYPPSKKDGVLKMMPLHKSEFENSRDSAPQDSSTIVTSIDNNETIEVGSQNTTEELISSVDQMTDAVDPDSDSDDLSLYALLESFPDVDKLCDLINNNPVELPKILSRQGPVVFEKILEHPQVYIELLNAGIVDHIGSNNGIDQIATKNDEAIDRLVKKGGYEKEMVLQVYQACHFNEIDAAELLNYLH